MKNAPSRGETIDLHKLPDGSFGTLHDEEKINPEELRDHLDSALNPPKTSARILNFRDFSKVKKPTELEAIVPEQPVGEKEKTETVETKSEEHESYKIPESLISYITDLVNKEHKPLNYLLQIDFPNSNKSEEDWEKTLATYRDRDVISEDEFEKARSLLSEGKTEKHIPSAIDIAMKVTDKYVKPKEVPKPVEVPKEILTAVEIAMAATDKYVKEKPQEPAKIETPALSQEALEKNLEDAREMYIGQIVAWKNKQREKKGIFARILSELGMEKQMPESEEPQDIRDARDAYLEARKLKNKDLFSKVEIRKKSIEGQIFDLKEITYEVNPALEEDAEKEYALVQQGLEEAMPELEKGIIHKWMERWSNVSQRVREVTAGVLASGVDISFETGAGKPMEVYTGYRLDKATAVGLKKVDGIFKRKNEEAHEEALSQYGTNIDEHNFIEREKSFSKALDKQKDVKKRQRLIKAGLATAVGMNLSTALDGIRTGDDLAGGKMETDEKGNEIYTYADGSRDVIIKKKDVETPKPEAVVTEEVVPVKDNLVYPDFTKFSSEEAKEEEIKKEDTHEVGALMVLDDKYQEGEQYKTIRQDFTRLFEKTAPISEMGTTPIAIKFEGGRIYVVQGVDGNPYAVKVLLNGKEIATGEVTRDNKTNENISTVKLDPELKGHWYLAKNVYQRAFEHAENIIKTLPPPTSNLKDL